MTTNPASAPGPSLTALRRDELTARNVRGVEAPDFPGVASSSGAFFAGLRAVPDAGPAHLSPSFLRGAKADPVADTAHAGGRLDRQGRLTCKKLIKSLAWEPGIELAAYFLLERPLVLIRRVVTGGNDLDGAKCDCGRCVEAQADATSLDERWVESFEDVDLTSKWELSLHPGLCNSAGLAVPGEVVALALPHLDAVLITSAAAAVAALFDGVATSAIPEPVNHHR